MITGAILEKFITTNLGSNEIPNALELAEKISGSLKEGSLDLLESINNDVNDWLSLNDLMPSEGDETAQRETTPPSENNSSQGNSKSDASEDPVNTYLSFTVKSYSLIKEVGDGFDNFEVGTNEYLLPVILVFEDTFELDDLSIVLEFDLNSKIYPEPDASLAFASQEGIDSFFDTSSAQPNKELAIVFIFPIEGLESELTILKLFSGENLIGQKNIEITK